MRPNTIFCMLFLLACAFGLYHVKYMVRNVKKDVSTLTAQLKDQQQAMHVLDAEWAHLVRPGRLEELADGHLGLVPVSVKQLQDDVSVLPVRDEEPLPDPAPNAVPGHDMTASHDAAMAKPVSYAR